jgi:hypothetical protein
MLSLGKKLPLKPLNKGNTVDPKNRLGYIIAEQPKQVVFCVGAGISARYGVPAWEKLNKELGERLVAFFAKHKKPDDVALLKNDLAQFKDQWSLGGFLKEKIPGDLYINWVREILGRRSNASNTFKNIWGLSPKGVGVSQAKCRVGCMNLTLQNGPA